MSQALAKLDAFVYDDLGDGRYSIRKIKDKFAESVEIPEGVVEIQALAFSGGTLLRSITLPKSLLTVRSSAFEKCTALQEVIFLGEKCTLEKSVFQGCSELKKVVLPSALTTIPSCLFSGASSLKEIVLPNTVTRIESFPFQETAIERINLPISIEFLDGCAFVGNVKRVHYMGTKEQWEKVNKEGSTYQKASWRDFKITFEESASKSDASAETKNAASKAKTAKKSAPKKIDGKTKDDFLRETRICKTAIELGKKQKTSLKRSDILGTILRLVLVTPIAAFLLNRLFEWGWILSILISLGLVLILNVWLIKGIHKEQKVTSQDLDDCFEVLGERVRVANLCASALETGGQVSETEKKYQLSFLNAESKQCGNCAYMGTMVKKTTTTYSDGTEKTSSKVDHYFCNNLGGASVKKINVCDKFLAKRVARAFDNAEELYKRATQTAHEQAARDANGFR